jgi:flagellar protein FliO/FliZ
MDWMDWARGAFGLLATLALILGASVLARRLGMARKDAGAAHRRVSVVDSVMLDPRRRLVVVRFDGRDHMILLSPTGDRPIAAGLAPAAPAGPAPSQETQA